MRATLMMGCTALALGLGLGACQNSADDTAARGDAATETEIVAAGEEEAAAGGAVTGGAVTGDTAPGDTATGAAAAPDTPVSRTPTNTARNAPRGDCGASQVESYVGKSASGAVRTEISAKSGAATVRWIGPDTAVTEDYNPARLNVRMGTDAIITGVDCG